METLQVHPEAEQTLVDKVFYDLVSRLIVEDTYSSEAQQITYPTIDSRKIFEKISDATGTIFTPANAIDAACFIGAKKGIDQLDTWKGIGLTCLSFMGDFVDGRVARATNTASPLGEKIDVTGDKVKLAYALVKIWELDLAPKPLVGCVALQNTVNAGLAVADKVINQSDSVIHASWFGKRAIFLQQWGLGLHVIGSQMEKDSMEHSRGVKIAGNVLGYAGVGLGLVATRGYYQTLRSSIQNRRKQK